MKRLLLWTLVVGIVMSPVGACFAQGNPRGKATLTLAGKAAASVEYGRPSLKGRTADQLLGQLQPGEVWRLGADTSTTFSAAMDLVVGGATIPKGDYSLWARREAGNTWKLVFNKQHGQWGTQHDPAQDFAAVPLEMSKLEKPEEMVTLVLANDGKGGTLSIRWGEMQLSTKIAPK